jgi:tetratricopeptide (TPR) repeat protein
MFSFPVKKLSIGGIPLALLGGGRLEKGAGAESSSLAGSRSKKAAGGGGSRSERTQSSVAGRDDRWLVAGICLFLVVVVWVVFGPTLHYEFVNFDDDVYVYENPAVARGMTLPGIIWAFTHIHSGNWHPLTWVSHMVDCQWYGLNPGGHHFTNVLLHTVTVLLVFLVLRRLTKYLWRSAFVAAIFAIHPLRVESVAWVAERKDVLSGFFFLLTLLCYAKAVTSNQCQVARTKTAPASTMSRVTYHESPFYWLALLFFGLGLMSKPMLVTAPLVLLLLDYWPLGRISESGAQSTELKNASRNAPSLHYSTMSMLRLFLEKWPFFGLAAASCVVTIFAQAEGLQPFKNAPLLWRTGNALISYVAYLGQLFWPSGLAVLYPFPANGVRISEAVLSLVVLTSITVGAFVLRRSRPYYLAGWLWYVIMLVPVIGLVQVGAQARADRYTYLPQIGLDVLLTWGVAELSAGWHHRRWLLGGLSTVILAALIYCAQVQISYWRDNESLWTHTLACTADNFAGHNNLGIALLRKDRVDEAITHFQTAMHIKPDYTKAGCNLCNALLKIGQVDEAIAQCEKVLQINPDYPEAHGNLGNALLQKGDVREAIVHYQRALQIKPDDAEIHNNLGGALLKMGSTDEAIAQYQTTLQIKPDNAVAHINLATALLQKGRLDEAIAQYQRALQIKPDDAETCYNLGNALLQKSRVDEAMVHFQKALQIKPGYAEAHINLGNALLQKGRVDEAIVHYKAALQIKPDSAEAHNNLGNALLQKGQVDEAIAYCQKALQIDPGSIEAHGNLGNALLQKGQVDEAIAAYQKVLQIKPDNANAHNNLGIALLKMGRVEQAIAQYQKALQIEPDFAQARHNLDYALDLKGRAEAALSR